MKKVLLVEDDPDISDLVELHLTDLGCETTAIDRGHEAFEVAKTRSFDLIILDLMLPEMDGITICQKLRALEVHTPILMLTAKAEEFDKVMGLESGADDYMTKPFGIRELIARVKAILRRADMEKEAASHESPLIERGKLRIDLTKRQVFLDEGRVELTPKEYALLSLLAGKPGRNFTREELLNLVWGYEFNGYEHTVNSHMNRLRSKIEVIEDHPEFIKTAWGVGYRFNEDI
ncbi:MAG: response regulator transcription factor [Cryomorphaceae bacterium]